MSTSIRALLILLLSALPISARAQSPNAAAIVVLVVDQTGAVVTDATVSIVNTATGATREAPSSGDGSATVSALSLTGAYTIHVNKPVHCGGRRGPGAPRR